MTNNTTYSVQLDLSSAPRTLIRYAKKLPRVAFIYQVKPNNQRVIAIAELDGERVYLTSIDQIESYINNLQREGFITQQPNFRPEAFVPKWVPPTPQPQVLSGYKQSHVSALASTFTEDIALAL